MLGEFLTCSEAAASRSCLANVVYTPDVVRNAWIHSEVRILTWNSVDKRDLDLRTIQATIIIASWLPRRMKLQTLCRYILTELFVRLRDSLVPLLRFKGCMYLHSSYSKSGIIERGTWYPRGCGECAPQFFSRGVVTIAGCLRMWGRDLCMNTIQLRHVVTHYILLMHDDKSNICYKIQWNEKCVIGWLKWLIN